MKILFVLPRAPWPPYAGQSRVAFNRAKNLRELGHDVFLFSYGRNIPLDRINLGLNDSSVYISPAIYSFSFISLFRDILRLLKSWLFKSLPLVSLLYTPSFVDALFRKYLITHQFDIIHFYSINSYPLWEIASKFHTPFVIDLVDSMTLNLNGRIKALPPLLRWIFSRELSCVEFFESNLPVYSDCFAYFVVGARDLECLSLSPFPVVRVKPQLACHSIGVDIPDSICVVKACDDQQPLDILFFGSLYYYPNVEAVVWFVNQVCPLLLASMDFTLSIAGAKPSKVLYDLADKYSYIRLLPNPSDMNSLISSSAITVAPMRSGSGQQFKVIESLALSTPVVATSIAATPLGLTHREQVLVSDSARGFADLIYLLLSDSVLYERLARSGHDFAKKHFSWRSKCLLLERFYRQAIPNLNS